ncbi:hypothetical protein MMH89_01250 [Candidatus Comchoanobacter bicostacola]|uniref:Uncharacterized protein n=1 Tax=Candidatus Comchoanobacter bicostacola TaxID=2919598 RepID=A0ABY5DJX0_9GAMM|nr:hypothetical protein [Candidatus Comchoanobacter bicostacola]UTC24780.1 hypothetical protein MMH89_01250 [Candidatus Comchoanobacter bicostacola]
MNRIAKITTFALTALLSYLAILVATPYLAINHINTLPFAKVTTAQHQTFGPSQNVVLHMAKRELPITITPGLIPGSLTINAHNIEYKSGPIAKLFTKQDYHLKSDSIAVYLSTPPLSIISDYFNNSPTQPSNIQFKMKNFQSLKSKKSSIGLITARLNVNEPLSLFIHAEQITPPTEIPFTNHTLEPLQQALATTDHIDIHATLASVKPNTYTLKTEMKTKSLDGSENKDYLYVEDIKPHLGPQLHKLQINKQSLTILTLQPFSKLSAQINSKVGRLITQLILSPFIDLEIENALTIESHNSKS